ncbi:PAQR family membrane homeostasis protein TrhA [Cellulomonas bogoriensis]|uniref:Hemolysin III n=1 Tax=Cellulomonas bogoriensis 69B4 = DSM 16987 TaxID=1386082 RepID=A0A0A0C205_9CELL|nr:hemolysin III family protein [Cellulomonas bogoriensis]KGM13424.1 hemolysin III [Cellulomonas bogoriensis 69B4 = DSM 16987]
METRTLSRDGSVHVTDERLNTVSHLAATCFALVGAALLIAQAGAQGDPWKIVGFSVYGVSIVTLFASSTLHHGIDRGPRVNEILRTLDYCSVFLLIAGSITPLVLVLFRNTYGWTVLGVVWAIAAAGIVLRSLLRTLPKYVTNTLYIVLGWMPVLLAGAGVPLPVGAYILMAAGGLAYSAGFVIFVIERPNPVPGVLGFHEIWHLIVVLAATLHYLLMYLYVLPA